MADKIDLKRQHKALFSAKTEPMFVDVPDLSYLMVDGAGAPAESNFRNAVGALFAVAYTIKFARKKAGQGPDYGVAPLEALWWSDDPAGFDLIDRPQTTRWTAMIMQPEFVSIDDLGSAVDAARTKLTKKKEPDNPALAGVRLNQFVEGRAAQLLHVGAYADEAPAIQRLHDFVAGESFSLAGKHHEIYLNDPGRTPPEKLKTILRQPVG